MTSAPIHDEPKGKSMFATPFAQAIAALGETPESVTNKLREMGIKGYRRMCSRCPIAEYLKACGFKDVTVAAHANRYNRSDDSDEAILLPLGVRNWIVDFDNGKYPEFYLE